MSSSESASNPENGVNNLEIIEICEYLSAICQFNKPRKLNHSIQNYFLDLGNLFNESKQSTMEQNLKKSTISRAFIVFINYSKIEVCHLGKLPSNLSSHILDSNSIAPLSFVDREIDLSDFEMEHLSKETSDLKMSSSSTKTNQPSKIANSRRISSSDDQNNGPSQSSKIEISSAAKLQINDNLGSPVHHDYNQKSASITLPRKKLYPP